MTSSSPPQLDIRSFIQQLFTERLPVKPGGSAVRRGQTPPPAAALQLALLGAFLTLAGRGPRCFLEGSETASGEG